MAEVLLDTDLFVDHLRMGRRLPAEAEVAAFSTITRAELYSGQRADESVIDLLLSVLEEIEVTRQISAAAGRIRRHHGLALPDAFVAASAIARGLELWTRNLRHYERVPDLRVVRPE